MRRRQRRSAAGRALAAITALATANVGCVPAKEGALDTTGFSTLITGDFASGEFVPRVIDLRRQAAPLAFPVADGQLVPLGLWRDPPEVLRLPAEVVAAPADGCVARRLPLERADRVMCLTASGTTACPTPLDPRAAVETLEWSEPDPCTRWRFDEEFTREDFDVQTTTMAEGSRELVAAGAAFVLVALGRGRMLIGQLSGGVPGMYSQNTELAVLTPADLGRLDQVPRVRHPAAFTAGAPRSADEAWLGTSDGRLAVFDARTASIAWVTTGTTGIGAISDLAAHPRDPQRVYAVTQACGLYVREEGQDGWTAIQPSLEGLPLVGPGVIEDECGARITMVAPGEALVGGLPAELTGRPTNVNYTANRDLLLRVRGSRATAEDPWPSDTVEARRFLKIHVVTQFVDAEGRLTEVALGGRYTVVPTPTKPPFKFGEGRNVMFTRLHDAPDAKWSLQPAFPERRPDGSPISPVLFSDAFGANGEDTRSHFRGFFAGATLTLFAAEDLRMRRGTAFPLAEVSRGWGTAGMIILVSRVRPDDDGGFVIATGNSLDARTEQNFRVHWWRPR